MNFFLNFITIIIIFISVIIFITIITKVLYENLFGFRQGHSTHHALITLVDNITKSLDKRYKESKVLHLGYYNNIIYCSLLVFFLLNLIYFILDLYMSSYI